MKTRLAFIFILFVNITGCKNSNQDKLANLMEMNRPENVGEIFPIEGFLDTAGVEQKIDLDKSKLTIIDFWFNECPPCNEEMSQFRELIKGKEKDIGIISISISSFPEWKSVFSSRLKRYSFLKDSLPNWKHLVVKSGENPALRNSIANDRHTELKSRLNVNSFPSYFVLDNKGKIILRPVSAVSYLKKLPS